MSNLETKKSFLKGIQLSSFYACFSFGVSGSLVRLPGARTTVSLLEGNIIIPFHSKDINFLLNDW